MTDYSWFKGEPDMELAKELNRMPSSLERIETQQWGSRHYDVMKLAEALDLWCRSHLDNCTGCTDCNFALQAKRTLKEVAGD